MKKHNLEDMLDEIFPPNITMREGRVTLPTRLNHVAIHLFCYPNIGAELDRRIRDQIFHLNNVGHLNLED